MARRSSARLRSQNSTTPKRVSLSHDAPITRTPRTVPARLASLQERDEVPGAFPQSASPKSNFELNAVVPSRLADAATPTKAAPIQPAESEMHPQLHHQSTAKPRDEARHLGFSSMAPHTEPPKQASRIATLQATPTRARNLEEDVTKSPSYHFTFRREHSLELSPEAKKLMYEKREEAAKIREQMIADGEAMPTIDEVLAARKIAKPKGRFSQVHSREFEKMDSIISHPSTMRQKMVATPIPDQLPRKDTGSPSKCLKRSPSKAGFDHSSTPSRPNSRDEAKPLPTIPGSHLPRTTSVKDLQKAATVQPAPSAKRVKRTEVEDVSATRPGSSDADKPLPATPCNSKQLPRTTSIPNLGGLTTPTQASLARAASIKSAKATKIPAPTFAVADSSFASTKIQAGKEECKASPALLARSPSKPSFFARTNNAANPSTMKASSPLLARSPLKAGGPRKAPESKEAQDAAPKINVPSLLSRSPMKAMMGHVCKSTESESPAPPKPAVIPFLARSPTKIPIAPTTGDGAQTTSKSTPNKLLGRFNLLRQSPMKSILRSPQRLYSDDPAKVAAGTHLATPEKYVEGTGKSTSVISSSSNVLKHVDFTSSTKARHDKTESATPSTTPTPSPNTARVQEAGVNSASVAYPDLPADTTLLSPSPQKRRQTSAPRDFTFRAGSQDIVFGRSPDVKTKDAQENRRSTIRMVTSNFVPPPAPVAGSKKRKFEFENNPAADVDIASEKENTPVVEAEEEEEQRPAKRAKPSTAAMPAKHLAGNATAPSTARRTTLGVKPKGEKTASPIKRASTISQARLAALSQPKRRG